MMAKDRSPDRSHGGPGSSHQDANQPKSKAGERHGPEVSRTVGATTAGGLQKHGHWRAS
jgi:hypothetical protein